MNYSQILDANKEAMLENLQKLIAIKSVEEAATPEYPFGKGVADALSFMLLLADKMGFSARNMNNYIGYADFGEGAVEDGFAILVHLDVVPEGNGWDTNPYEGIIKDGKMYGRGSLDNKGPAMAALYAMYSLKQSGFMPSKRIRLILGCDEESGWLDIDHYKKTEKMPRTGISPDAEYPIINNEKAILHLEISQTFHDNGLLIFKSGERANMVPDFAEAKIGSEILTESGKGAHASTPEKGENAAVVLLERVLESSEKGEGLSFAKNIYEKIGHCITGECLGFPKAIAREMTVNIGIVDIVEKEGKLVLDIRFPEKITKEEVMEKVGALFGMGKTKMQVLHFSAGHFVPESDILIKTLKSVYEMYMNKEAYCITIGGGTFARSIEQGVAFGPVRIGEESLIHGANEYYKINDMIEDAKMMAEVLYRLT